jgi:hypothetical protein
MKNSIFITLVLISAQAVGQVGTVDGVNSTDCKKKTVIVVSDAVANEHYHCVVTTTTSASWDNGPYAQKNTYSFHFGNSMGRTIPFGFYKTINVEFRQYNEDGDTVFVESFFLNSNDEWVPVDGKSPNVKLMGEEEYENREAELLEWFRGY